MTGGWSSFSIVPVADVPRLALAAHVSRTVNVSSSSTKSSSRTATVTVPRVWPAGIVSEPVVAVKSAPSADSTSSTAVPDSVAYSTITPIVLAADSDTPNETVPADSDTVASAIATVGAR